METYKSKKEKQIHLCEGQRDSQVFSIQEPMAVKIKLFIQITCAECYLIKWERLLPTLLTLFYTREATLVQNNKNTYLSETGNTLTVLDFMKYITEMLKIKYLSTMVTT